MRIEKQPLAVLTACTLREGIASGIWKGRLPGEIRLSRSLGVSRSTLRQALKILRSEGYIGTQQGKQTEICPTATGARGTKLTKQINILAPFPLEKMPNYVIFWLDELRSQLHEAGLSLNVHAGKIYYHQQTGDALEKLVTQHPADCWLLAFSKVSIQRWFADRSIPCVIAGLPGEGISSPAVFVDHEAILFHAVGRLTARGHKRIAMVARSVSSPGLDVFLRSFEETCSKMGSNKIEGRVLTLKHDSPEYVGRQLLGCLNYKSPPSAFIILNPFHAVTAFSALPGNGVAIPRDVSIVTTYGDRNLHYLSPEPSHYNFDSSAYARKMFDCIKKIAAGMDLRGQSYKIMPDPIEGGSISFPNIALNGVYEAAPITA